VGTVNQVRVVIESDAGIRVAELPLRDLGSAACIKHGGGVHVPEGMKACPSNLQCVAQWPQLFSDNGRSKIRLLCFDLEDGLLRFSSAMPSNASRIS
jgi:hypothetical protein